MSNSSRVLVIVVVLAFSLMCGSYTANSVSAQDRGQPRERIVPITAKWEYRIVKMYEGHEDETEIVLNKLGAEGYEIAFVTSSTSAAPVKGSITHYTLKRAKQ